jgi:hypothetical protein
MANRPTRHRPKLSVATTRRIDLHAPLVEHSSSQSAAPRFERSPRLASCVREVDLATMPRSVEQGCRDERESEEDAPLSVHSRPLPPVRIVGLTVTLSFAQTQAPAPEVQVTTAAIPTTSTTRAGTACLHCLQLRRGKLALRLLRRRQQSLGRAASIRKPELHSAGRPRPVCSTPMPRPPTDFATARSGSTRHPVPALSSPVLPGQPTRSNRGDRRRDDANGAWTINSCRVQGAAHRRMRRRTVRPGRVHQLRLAPKRRLYWRKLSDINTEHELPISHLTDGNSRRWVPGTHQDPVPGTRSLDDAGPARPGIHLRHRHRQSSSSSPSIPRASSAA